MQLPLPLPSPWWRWLALLSALGCLSCAGKDSLNPVQGKLLYKNQPMSGALVTFHRKGADEVSAVPSTGLVKEDGTFTLTTGQNEGAPAGDYVITVIWPEEVGPKGKKVISTAPPESHDRLNGVFANAANSSLKVQIKNGVNQLEPFQLK
jgi:hypothetical protein